MSFSFLPLPIIPDSVVEDRMVINTVNSIKLSKHCIANWWIRFSKKDKNEFGVRAIATADKARYNMIHGYEVELKRLVVNLHINKATIYTSAQKEQLLEHTKQINNDELIKVFAVKDLIKLWCISTTTSTALRITTLEDGIDQIASTPKRSNKKSD